jgi:4-diphosphocytidyl-2-C-methyl-D-erythritol kinase
VASTPSTEIGDAVAIVRAPAKLTVTLRLIGVRPDGYHLIDAEMVTLDLADELTFRDAPDGKTTLTIDGPFGAGLPIDGSNLVARALAKVGRPAHVHIAKNIPAQGGLGGGSADAAAALRWAGCHDLDVAVAIGADVPFCVVGGRARVQGIGELVDPLPPLDRTFTLVVPPVGVSTIAAYKAWDALGAPRAEGPNDLEPAALVVEPALVRWRDRIREAAGVAPTLAGSGSTWFVDGARPDLAAALPDAIVRVTRTPSS